MNSSLHRPTYYAVKGGRGGNSICTTWDHFQYQARDHPNAFVKSFRSLNEAQRWLNAPEPGPSTQQQVSQPNPMRLPPPSPAQSPPMAAASQMSTTDEPLEPPPLQLSPEQQLVLDKIARGENVFFTGPAGTGKSVLIRELIRWATRAHRIVFVTASTGMAAVNIKGMTLHSWAGCGLCKRPANSYVKQISQGNNAAERWMRTELLIIDEISMINSVFFDKLEFIARHVRNDDRPFGGIQLAVCGDFFQLPPVQEKNSKILFAFQAHSWSRCFGSPVTLHRVFRQENQEFVDMLNSMRMGIVTSEISERMNQLSRNVNYDDGIEPTDLFATRAEVAAENDRRMDRLSGPMRTYKSHDTAGIDDRREPVDIKVAIKLLNKDMAPEVIKLKVGCQVMLIKNLIQGELVNGSTGRVVDFLTAREAVNGNTDIGFIDPTNEMQDGAARGPSRDPPPHILESSQPWPVVHWTSGRTMMMVPVAFTIENVHGEIEATRGQIPLILAWAISIHKSQGQTLERVRINLARTFENGQAYVGLSRATSLDTLQVLNFDPTKVVAHSEVREWHDGNLRQEQHEQEFEDEMDTEEAVRSYFQGHS